MTLSISVGPSQNPSLSPSGLHGAAVDDDLGAVGLAGVDVGRHLVAVGLGDQRAHVGVAGAVAGLDAAGAFGDLGDQIVGDRPDRDTRRNGHAAFTGRAEAGVDHRVGRQIQVGVGQDHRVVLGPAQGLDPLTVRGAGLVDVLRDRGGAHEGHRLDLRVGQQFVDGGLVALEHVEHPGRQAGLGPQLGQPQRRRGILLRRLEDDGVARRDRDREEPHRHHGREVERGDDADRAQRLADRVHVDLGRGVLGEPALEQVWDAAGEFDDLLAAAHLTQRVGDDLAVLAGDDLGQLLLAGVEQFAEVEQDLRCAWPARCPATRGTPRRRRR